MIEDHLFSQSEHIPSESEWLCFGEEQASNPDAWLLQAESRMRASEICWHAYQKAIEQINRAEDQFSLNQTQLIDLSLSDISNYLLAVALENLLKSHILWIDRDAARNRDSGFYSHDLVVLARKTDMFADEEWLHYYLEQLTHLGIWYGRYPIPVWTNERKKAVWALHPSSGFCDLELKPEERFPGYICPSKRNELVKVYNHFLP